MPPYTCDEYDEKYRDYDDGRVADIMNRVFPHYEQGMIQEFIGNLQSISAPYNEDNEEMPPLISDEDNEELPELVPSSNYVSPWQHDAVLPNEDLDSKEPTDSKEILEQLSLYKSQGKSISFEHVAMTVTVYVDGALRYMLTFSRQDDVTEFVTKIAEIMSE